jgi:hypothetical protein
MILDSDINSVLFDNIVVGVNTSELFEDPANPDSKYSVHYNKVMQDIATLNIRNLADKLSDQFK